MNASCGCGIGSWGGRCLSMGDYVRGPGATTGGGRCRRGLMLTILLLGLSPVLTVIALGTVFYRPSPRVVAFAVLSTLSAVFVQA